MIDFTERVAIPPKDQMNRNLSSASEATMIRVFGVPGALTSECGHPEGPFAKKIVSAVNVGPFRVTGLASAVDDLKQIFSEIKLSDPDLFVAVRTEGMLCVRHRRHNPAHFSNHSWGAAIDLYFGQGVVPQGERITQRGNRSLAPYFEKYGWYWGAEFSGDSVDSMHFEMSEERVNKLR